MNMKKIALLFSAVSLGSLAAAFDTGSGGSWKVDADGNLEKDDKGNPIYIGAGNKEMTIEPNTISRLNAEAKAHREAKETAEAALKPFEGIDPVEAKKAIADMKDVDLSKMVEAGEVEKVKQTITEQFTTQLAEKDKALADSNGTINSLRLDRAFDTSSFINDNVILPDYVRMKYGDRFKVVEGKVVPHGADGNPLPSKERLGEVMTFDEAVAAFVETDPNKDTFLKANGQGGSGNSGEGGNRGQGRYIKRSDFDSMSPADQTAAAAAASKGEAQIVD